MIHSITLINNFYNVYGNFSTYAMLGRVDLGSENGVKRSLEM